MINKCEICGQKKLLPVLSLGSHPLCDDLIKVGSSKKSKLHKIEIIFCKNCNVCLMSSTNKFIVKQINL